MPTWTYPGRFDEPWTDAFGNAQRSATIEIRLVGTTTKATLYASRAKTALANPVPTGVASTDAGLDTLGNLVFYADPGEYDAATTINGVTATKRIVVGVDAELPAPNGTYASVPTAGTPATAVATTGDQSVAGIKTFRGPVNIRAAAGDTGDGPVLRLVGDTSAGSIQMRHTGDYGYLLHLSLGGANSPWSCIGVGVDAGTGSGILIANKLTGTGLKVLQYSAITSATAYGIYVNQQSTLASAVFLEQAAAGAAPTLDVVGNVTQAGDKLIRFRHATTGEFFSIDSQSGVGTWSRSLILSPTSGNALQVANNSTVAARKADNSAWRSVWLCDTSDRLIIGDQNISGAVAIRAGGPNAITLETNGSTRLTVDSQGLTVQDGKAIFATSTAGLKIGNLSTHYLGFWGAIPVQRQTLPASGSVTAADIRSLLITIGLAA